jgi:hypothetical protein
MVSANWQAMRSPPGMCVAAPVIESFELVGRIMRQRRQSRFMGTVVSAVGCSTRRQMAASLALES